MSLTPVKSPIASRTTGTICRTVFGSGAAAEADIAAKTERLVAPSEAPGSFERPAVERQLAMLPGERHELHSAYAEWTQAFNTARRALRYDARSLT